MAPIPLPHFLSQIVDFAAKTSSAIQPRQSLPLQLGSAHDANHFYPRSLKRAIPLEILSLTKRQSSADSILAIPSTYDNLNSSPAPGVVAGIVLGSVAGFLLLIYFTYTIFTLGRGGFRRNETYIEEEVVRRRSRSPRRSRSRSEVLEVRTPPRRESRRETVTEIRETVSRPRSRSVVSSSHGGGEDIVEVIEEHSPPPRRKPSNRVSGSFRTIDPLEPGGGSAPRRSVRR